MAKRSPGARRSEWLQFESASDAGSDNNSGDGYFSSETSDDASREHKVGAKSNRYKFGRDRNPDGVESGDK